MLVCFANSNLRNFRLRIFKSYSFKLSQDYQVNARVRQVSIPGLSVFLLYINEIPDDIICNIAIYADDTTLYFKRNQAFDLWQQLEVASESGSDL